MEDDVTFDVAGLHADDVGWTAGATVELKVSNSDDPVLYRDYDDKEINYVGENPDWEDAQDDVGSGDDTIAADPPPTPSLAACGIHEDWQSGDHSWVAVNSWSMHCTSHGFYACESHNHSLQASCYETNSNGDYCTVTSFYACESHTHEYPNSDDTDTGDGGSYGCDYNAEYDYCTDTGWCLAGSGQFEIGMCGHRWCCCAP
ncbi:hypothetical protein J4G08_14555 [Candidatus Poribacteria bacterium]|nr:hypothetical protein [Candidatus Poribacteria bacterium]